MADACILTGYAPTLGMLYSWPSPQQCTSPEMKLKRTARRLEISCSVSTSIRRSCGDTDWAWLGPWFQNADHAAHLLAALCDCLVKGPAPQALQVSQQPKTPAAAKTTAGLSHLLVWPCRPVVRQVIKKLHASILYKAIVQLDNTQCSCLMLRQGRHTPRHASSRQVKGHTASSEQQQGGSAGTAIFTSGSPDPLMTPFQSI